MKHDVPDDSQVQMSYFSLKVQIQGHNVISTFYHLKEHH